MKFKNIHQLLAVLTTLTTLTACDGEKDLIIIDEQLPIKTSTLYMVGDATPNGWNIDAPTPLSPTEEDPLVFIWEGPLNTGEMKLCLTTGSWDAPFIRPVNNGDAIGRDGVSETAFDMHAGDPDNKWVITDAGIYNLRFDLRNHTMRADFVREQDAPVIEPIVADALYIVGDATPCGWNIDSPQALEKKSDYIFVYEGPLNSGELKACTTPGSWDVPFVRPVNNGCKITKAGVEDQSFVYTTAPDNKWRVEEPAVYRLTFDLEAWTIAVECIGEFKPTPVLYLIGEATPGGWSWDSAIAIEAQKDNDQLFIWEGELGRGIFKAALTKDFSAPFYRPTTPNCEVSDAGVASHEMVFTTEPDDQWLVTVAGTYRLTFNTADMTFDAVCLSSQSAPEPLYMIGDATAGGWSLDAAAEFTPVAGIEGEYTWTGTLTTGTFKACKIKDFSAPFYRPSSANCEVSADGITAHDVIYTTEPDDQWKVVTEGTYKITLNIVNMTIDTEYLD